MTAERTAVSPGAGFPPQPGGRFRTGLAQALGVWVAVLLLMLSVRQPALAWAGPCAALVACVLLGQWHRRRARADSAVGAFTGSVLWPVLIGAALIVIAIVTESRSE